MGVWVCGYPVIWKRYCVSLTDIEYEDKTSAKVQTVRFAEFPPDATEEPPPEQVSSIFIQRSVIWLDDTL